MEDKIVIYKGNSNTSIEIFSRNEDFWLILNQIASL